MFMNHDSSLSSLQKIDQRGVTAVLEPVCIDIKSDKNLNKLYTSFESQRKTNIVEKLQCFFSKM